MKRIVLVLLSVAMLCSGAKLHRNQLKRKCSSDLLPGSANTLDSKYRVIIQWAPSAAAPSQKITNLGGTVRTDFKSINGGSYIIPQAALDSLSQDPDVKYISADRIVHQKLALAASAIGAPSVWQAGYTGAGIGVAVIDSGINPDKNLSSIVYSEDFTTETQDGKSGSNPGLVGGLVSTLSDQGKAVGPDWFGHGQHVAGIIASNGSDSRCLICTTTFVGIAPRANLINLRVLDGMGAGNESDVIAAVERAISLQSTYNIRVINMSLGRPVFENYQSDPLCQVVEAAWKAGIVVVVAAGNDGRDNSFGNQGYGTILSPANDPYVITVSAMKTMGTPNVSDDLIASYSSKGPTSIDQIVKPDIVAPGNLIVSLRAKKSRLPLEAPLNIAELSSYQTYYGSAYAANQPITPQDATTQPPDAHIGHGYSSTYLVMSGTSMAAAVVSGAAADLLEAAPSLTPDQVKMLLMKTASKTFPDSSTVTDPDSGATYTDYYDMFTVGAGYMNVAAAIAGAKNVPTGVTAISPTATYDPNSGNVYLVFDPSSAFAYNPVSESNSADSSSALWNSNAVWGNTVVSGDRALWGSRAMWGSSTVDSERALWGSSGIWSERALWGSSTDTSSESIIVTGEK
ncbi:MAG TPA: S8 family serine peptidase [Bryobacteraceae bacterium]|jgi:serine protease AprX|nr:S8 family serine peptidase [Bryobacteraceae bacterium]